MQQCIEVTRVDHSDCFFLCLMSFIYQVASDLTELPEQFSYRYGTVTYKVYGSLQ